MKPHTIPSVLAAVTLAFTMAACGDDSVEQGTSDSLPDVTTPGTPDTTPDAPVGGYEHPTSADSVVFSYAELGGFTTREYAFQRTPMLLVSGDGRVFSPGAQIAVYPGPLLPAIQVQQLSEEGIQALLAAAEEAGLFADVDYTEELNVADATTATLTIQVNGETYVHEAYALGIGGMDDAETSPERAALADFVARLGDLSSIVGAEALGETELYAPEQYAIEALPVDDLSAYGSDGIEPTVVDWPADASVALADASNPGGESGCTLVPATEFGDLFASANQLTFFSSGEQVYQVLVRPVLPGDDCTN